MGNEQSIVEELAQQRGGYIIEGLPGDPPAPITSDLKLDGLDRRQQREVEWCFWLSDATKYPVSEEDLRAAVIELTELLQEETVEANWRDELPDVVIEDTVKASEHYAKHFSHGTAGHNLYVLVAKLADLLDTRAAGAEGVEAPSDEEAD